jgi:hypothetical protein
MSEFEFDEKDEFSGPSFKPVAYQNQDKGLSQWLIKKGISKDEKHAYVVMFVIIVVAFGLSFFILKEPDQKTPVVNDSNYTKPSAVE